MKITLEVRAGNDYPLMFRGDKEYMKRLEATVRGKLQLRSFDTVEVKEIA
jgi:hypothetical protein